MAKLLDDMSNKGRVLWGIAGAIVAVGSKYVAQDHYWVRVWMDTREYDKMPGLIVFYAILLIVLGGIGAIFAVASRETHPMKLLAIAVSAPAIVTTWLGGTKPAAAVQPNMPRAHLEYILPVSSAYAADESILPAVKSSGGFWEGFRTPLGFGKDESRYRVIVGSYKNRTDAAQTVERIKKEDSTLNAFVGERQPNNEFYPVVVGGYLPYPQASELKARVESLSSVKDAYLSPYQWR